MASLAPSYQLKQLRVYGDYVRVLKAHPGKWQVRAWEGRGQQGHPANEPRLWLLEGGQHSGRGSGVESVAVW